MIVCGQRGEQRVSGVGFPSAVARVADDGIGLDWPMRVAAINRIVKYLVSWRDETSTDESADEGEDEEDDEEYYHMLSLFLGLFFCLFLFD